MNKEKLESSTALNLIMANEKGGEWKTTTAANLAAIVLDTLGNLAIFQVDEQDTLLNLFPQYARQLKFPNDENNRRNALADTMSIEAALEAMIAADGPPVIIDLGARLDARTARVFLDIDLAAETKAAGRRNVVLVPMHRTKEAVLLGARTIRRMRKALGSEAAIITLICGTRDEYLDETAQGSWDRYIRPEIDAHGMVTIPEIEDDVMSAMSKLNVNLCELIEMDPKDIAHRCNLSPIVAKGLVRRIMYHLGKLREEFAQVGLFR